jgi:hypothetical protein
MKKRKPVLAIRLLFLVTALVIMTTGIADATPTATRTLPAELVPADRSFSVEIEVSDYGTVVETPPDGFTYMSSSLDTNAVHVYGPTNTIEFKLTKDKYFTYSVALRYHDIEEGTYTFHGILKRSKKEYVIGGDTEIMLAEPEEEDDAEPTATRTLPEEPIAVGERFTIEIEASHYGYFGNVVETLPKRFVYGDYSGLTPGSVEAKDNTVEFTLRGEPSFAYTVTAPDTEGTYTFSGILKDEEKKEYDIEGDTEIVVGESGKEVTIVAPNITALRPVEAVVNNGEDESKTFNITINQTVNIIWQINGTEVQTNESVTEATYTNTSAVVGTWNVSAIATNITTGLSDVHTWIWSVTLTPTATSTPAVNITLTLTSTPTPPTPLVTPTPTPKPSPSHTSTPMPAPPGFEAGFVFVSISAVAYLLLHRKKGDSEG